jgi:hypothetical protein
MDAELKLRKELSQKRAKMSMFGKGISEAAYDEGSAILEAAAQQVAFEDAEELPAKECLLHEAVVRSLQRELDTVRSKLRHHSTHRELVQEQEIRSLRAEIRRLQAREHWESHYGWTLPGAYLLTSEKDGLCSCELESRLYGRFARGADSAGAGSGAGGSAGAASAGAGGHGRSDEHAVRTCSCGNRY